MRLNALDFELTVQLNVPTDHVRQVFAGLGVDVEQIPRLAGDLTLGVHLPVTVHEHRSSDAHKVTLTTRWDEAAIEITQTRLYEVPS